MDIEKDIEKFEAAEEKIAKKFFSEKWFKNLAVALSIFLVLGIFAYWKTTAGQVNIDNSSITAPIINLSPSAPGILSEIYVDEGEKIGANAPVAKVGNEIIISRVPGIITFASKQIGQFFNAGAPVVSMIDPSQEKVVGQIDENKGLADIKVGQPVTFTVDAFGGRKFIGVVSEVSPISNQGDIVFSISDQRQEKQFDIKADFNIAKYDMLKPGMSAKMTVFTK